MIFDVQNEFSAAQAVTAAAASTNYIDLGAVRDLGLGENLYVVLNVDVALTDSGSDSTVTVDLQGDSTTTFTPDGTQTLFTVAAVAAIGTQYIARVQPGFAGNYRYIQLYFTPNNGNLTTGSFTAFLCHGVQKATSYPNNSTIS